MRRFVKQPALCIPAAELQYKPQKNRSKKLIEITIDYRMSNATDPRHLKINRHDSEMSSLLKKPRQCGQKAILNSLPTNFSQVHSGLKSLPVI